MRKNQTKPTWKLKWYTNTKWQPFPWLNFVTFVINLISDVVVVVGVGDGGGDGGGGVRVKKGWASNVEVMKCPPKRNAVDFTTWHAYNNQN